jgi:hypothetical protein
VLAQHGYQVQRRRFGDAEAGQASVRLPTMMGLVIEEMNERLPARLALRLARMVTKIASRSASYWTSPLLPAD